MEKGTKEDPWKLKTPPQTSAYEMYRDQKDGKDVIVCVVGKTTLLYDYRCLEDLQDMLKKHGDWMELGSADEQKPAKEGTVEAWGRSQKNPVGGWYGLKKDCVEDSACTFHHSWKSWALQKLRMMQKEIKCGRSSIAVSVAQLEKEVNYSSQLYECCCSKLP